MVVAAVVVAVVDVVDVVVVVLLLLLLLLLSFISFLRSSPSVVNDVLLFCKDVSVGETRCDETTGSNGNAVENNPFESTMGVSHAVGFIAGVINAAATTDVVPTGIVVVVGDVDLNGEEFCIEFCIASSTCTNFVNPSIPFTKRYCFGNDVLRLIKDLSSCTNFVNPSVPFTNRYCFGNDVFRLINGNFSEDEPDIVLLVVVVVVVVEVEEGDFFCFGGVCMLSPKSKLEMTPLITSNISPACAIGEYLWQEEEEEEEGLDGDNDTSKGTKGTVAVANSIEDVLEIGFVLPGDGKEKDKAMTSSISFSCALFVLFNTDMEVTVEEDEEDEEDDEEEEEVNASSVVANKSESDCATSVCVCLYK